MHSCGLDIGTRATKAVIIDDNGDVIGRGNVISGSKPAQAAEKAMHEALSAAGLLKDNIDVMAVTGYARRLMDDGLKFTSISCHAAGAFHACSDTRNVLNVGALSHAAIRLDENGQVHRFRRNDECSTGIGRYLERVSKTLEIPLDEIGQLALFSKAPETIPSNCSVMAENELLNLITLEKKPADILRGVYNALAERLAALLKQIWIENAVTAITGGVARNPGMVRAIEDMLGMKLLVGHDAEFTGAIGAAILARNSIRDQITV